MRLFLIIFVCVTKIHSESIEWFNGSWLPVVMYSNQYTNKTDKSVIYRGVDYYGLWTGWLLEAQDCGWLQVYTTSQRCTCDGRDIPLVQLNDFGNYIKNTLDFYEFNMNEPRPIIVVDSDDEVKAALSSKCMCGDKEITQLVFRKTSGNYLVSYEKKERKENSPNMTLVMVSYVPDLAEIYEFTKRPSEYLGMAYQEPTMMCHPSFFDDSAYVDSSESELPPEDSQNDSDELLPSWQTENDGESTTSSAFVGAESNEVQSSSTIPLTTSVVSSSAYLHPHQGIALLQLMMLLFYALAYTN